MCPLRQEGEIGTLLAFTQGPGIVLRCSGCENVVIRIVQTPEAIYLDARVPCCETGAHRIALHTSEEHRLKERFVGKQCSVYGERTDKTLGNLASCSLSNVTNSVPNRKDTAA